MKTGEKKFDEFEELVLELDMARIIFAEEEEEEEEARIVVSMKDITERKRAEEALRESEERFRLAINATKDGLWEWDIQTNQEFFSPRWCEIIGYSFDDPELPHSYNSWTSRIHPDDYDRVISAMNNHLEKGAKYNVDYRHRHKSGEYRWQNSIGQAFFDESGKPTKMVGCISDITERKQAEEALQESEDIFSQFMNHSPIYVFFKDENIKAIRLSKNFTEMLGRPLSELLGKNMDDLFPSDLSKSMVADDMRVLKEGKPIEVEEEMNGRVYSTIKFPIHRQGKPTYLAGFTIDTTERKQAEVALQESEERFRDLFDNAPVGYHEYDREGRISNVNRTELKMLGYTREEVIGQFLWGFVVEKEKVRQGVLAKLSGTQPPGRSFERTYRRKDGTALPVLIEDRLLLDKRGRIEGIRCAIQDITERRQAEEALRIEKERFQTLSEEAPFGMVTIEEDGTFRYMNPKFKELFGYELTDVPDGKTWFRKAYPDPTYRHHVIGTWIKDIEEFKRGEKRSEVFTVTCKDGTEKIINFIPVQLATGENLMACEDITERRRAEEALRESERRFQELFNGAPVGYFEYDAQGRITGVNQTELEMLGYTLEEMMGRSPWEFIVEEKEARNQIFAKLAGTMPPGRGFERTYRRKDGTTFPAICENRISRDGEGKIIGISSTIQDVTELKQAEEALRQNEEKYRTILENIEEGYFEVDIAGNFTFFNDSLRRMLGYSKDEMMGMGNKQYTDQEERKKLYQAFNEVYRTGEPTKEFDWEIITKDGTKRYIETSISLIKNSSGQPTGFRGVVRDITEQKRMEQERIKTEKLQSIGILAGGLAHDFNNLLTSILGNIDFAKSFVKRGDKIFDLLERAEKSSLRASDLTKQLITFSKGGAPVRRTVSIGNILQSATSFTLAGSNVISAFHISDGLWPVEIDEGQVRQVIHSIVLNARDAMPEGGAVFLSVENVTVNLKNELLLREGNYIRISIKDEGIGIPAENIPKIFDPYFTTKEMGSQKGMGLGLSVCHSIVKNHHGSITVESKVGVGTTLHIYLPVASKKVEEERGEAKIPRRKRVLVMDDEKEVRKILEEVLKDEGYEAAFAADGSEAINLYQEAKEAQRPFDAVILDLTVPGGMSGKETIKRLFEMDPEVKAIVSSGYHKDPIMLKFKEYGFKVALPKPYKISTLKRVLLEVTG